MYSVVREKLLIILSILLYSSIVLATEADKKITSFFEQADGLAIAYPEKADSIICILQHLIGTSDNPEYVAHSNIIKGYVEFSKENYSTTTDLLSQATDYYSINNHPKRTAQISLLNGLLYEQLVLYKEAFEAYSEAYEYYKETSNKENSLESILGLARLCLYVKEDPKPYLEKADKIVENIDTHFNRGCYWRTKAFLERNNNKKETYLKKALFIYKKNYQLTNQIKSLEGLANYFLDTDQLDSANTYYNIIIKTSGKNLEKYPPSRKSYFYSFASRLFLKYNNIDKATNSIQLAIKEAELFDKINILSLAWRFQFNIDTLKGDYSSAIISLEKANKYRLEYSGRIQTGQLKALNAKEKLRDIVTENKILHYEASRNRSQKIISILVFIIIINTLITIIFITRKNKKKEEIRRAKAERKVSEKEIEIHKKQVVLKNIKEKVENKSLAPLKKIEKISEKLDNSEVSSEWTTISNLFELKNPDARQTIYRRLPRLTDSEYQFIVLILCAYSTAQIASILGVKPETVLTKSYRLKIKYNIPGELSFSEFLNEIFISN
jgi:tetratricopeptide (TPR) repeat protein